MKIEPLRTRPADAKADADRQTPGADFGGVGIQTGIHGGFGLRQFGG